MRPLDGIRVLDLTRVVSGPYCTMMLGDMGADVIKIEECARGDDSRAFGPPFVGGESAYFLSVNRNKRSCCLNLKSAAGRRVLEKLIRESDVLVENFRPGTMERLGLGYETANALNPALIYCAISGFGPHGPEASRPGYDLIIQGESGFMDITGQADGPPTKIGTSVADLVSGAMAAQGIALALLAREKTGRGQKVDLSMLGAMASLLTFNAGIYFATGESPRRRGNQHATILPYETFRASDGWINIAVANDALWQKFCAACGLPELLQDARYRCAAARVEHRAALVPAIARVIEARPRAYWMKLLGAAGVPCGEIRTVGEVCASEQLAACGMIASMQHPTAGTVMNIGNPIHLSDTPGAAGRAPPLLGEHTYEVLTAVAGLSAEEIAGMERTGVVRTRRPDVES